MITSILLALTIQATPACNCPYADIPVVGHRGSGGSSENNPFAENTVPSVRNAYEEGAEWAEVDVVLSKDDEVVVIHDFTLDGTVYDLEGCVVDKAWSELENADATKESGADKGSAMLPTLAEVLAVTVDMNRTLLVELKVEGAPQQCDVDFQKLVNEAVATIRTENAVEHVMIISFSFEALEESLRIAPEIPVGFLTAQLDADILKEQADDSIAAGFASFNPLYAGFTIGRDNTTLTDLKEKDILIVPWTVNSRGAIETMFEGRVDGIITDEVATALEVREEQCARFVCEAPPETMETGGCSSVPQGAAPALPLLFAFALMVLRRRSPLNG